MQLPVELPFVNSLIDQLTQVTGSSGEGAYSMIKGTASPSSRTRIKLTVLPIKIHFLNVFILEDKLQLRSESSIVTSSYWKA